MPQADVDGLSINYDVQGSPTSKLLGRETGTARSTSSCVARTQMAMSRLSGPRRVAAMVPTYVL